MLARHAFASGFLDESFRNLAASGQVAKCNTCPKCRWRFPSMTSIVAGSQGFLPIQRQEASK